jgi:hypothetical protein
MKKVLIVIFTNGKLYKGVYDAAISQDYPECSVIISVRKSDIKKSSCENQVDHMNYVRHLCESSDADYFFFIDSDLIIPKNAVSNLILQLEQPEINLELFSHLKNNFAEIQIPSKKHIIGGWYKLAEKKKKTPTLWSPSRWVADNTLVSLTSIEKSVVRVDKIASGCIMMSREVMEKIPWRLDHVDINEHIGGHLHPCRCAFFGIDAQDAGYELWMDGSVVCKHLSVEKGILDKIIRRKNV